MDFNCKTDHLSAFPLTMKNKNCIIFRKTKSNYLENITPHQYRQKGKFGLSRDKYGILAK